MSREKDLKDLAILQAISGTEDPEHLGIQIEDNYLLRERMENRRESGFEVPDEHIPQNRSQDEKDLWKRNKWMEELEQSRTNRPQEPYDGAEEDNMVEKKEMGFVDPKMFDIVFATQVNIKQVKAKATGRWVTVITIGKDQDKVFLVTGRKDGNGTSLVTDWEEYMKDPKSAKKEVKKV